MARGPSVAVRSPITRRRRLGLRENSHCLASLAVEQAAEAIVVCDESGRVILAGQAARRNGRGPAAGPLLDAEAHYRVMVEQSPDGVVVVNPETTRFVEFNESACRMLGYSREEFAQLTVVNLEAAETPGEIQAHLADICRNGRTEFETRHRTRDGESRDILVRAQPIEVRGRVLCHVVWHDISQRKRAEAALVSSEVRYRRLFESAKDGILILDAETGMILDVNPFLVELLGISRVDLLGERIRDLGFFGDILASADRFSELTQTGYVRYDDLALKAAGGQRVEVEFVSNVYLVNGQRVIQCNIRDISERKRQAAKMAGQFEELQRWQDVTLCREDRLRDLKREVNNLCRRAGDAARYASEDVGPDGRMA